LGLVKFVASHFSIAFNDWIFIIPIEVLYRQDKKNSKKADFSITEADILMLNNMDNETVKKALRIIDNEKYVEVSGNVDEKRLVELAKMGVDFVSMGALTHTVQPLDITLLIEK
jgi:nicotinate-nucleotide pyrophosphorylase